MENSFGVAAIKSALHYAIVIMQVEIVNHVLWYCIALVNSAYNTLCFRAERNRSCNAEAQKQNAAGPADLQTKKASTFRDCANRGVCTYVHIVYTAAKEFPCRLYCSLFRSVLHICVKSQPYKSSGFVCIRNIGIYHSIRVFTLQLQVAGGFSAHRQVNEKSQVQ